MLTPATPGIAPMTFMRVPAGATTRSSRIAPARSEMSTRLTLAPAAVRTYMLCDRLAADLLTATLGRAANATPTTANLTRTLRM
jgi:hypothetical protein